MVLDFRFVLGTGSARTESEEKAFLLCESGLFTGGICAYLQLIWCEHHGYMAIWPYGLLSKMLDGWSGPDGWMDG